MKAKTNTLHNVQRASRNNVKITIIGGATVEFRHESRFTKNAFSTYLLNLGKRYREVYWWVSSVNGASNYFSQVPSHVTVVDLGNKGSRIAHLLRNIRSLWECYHSSEAVIVFLPNPYAVVLLFFSMVAKRPLLAYVGNDWVSENKQRPRARGMYESLLIKKILGKANCVLVRGGKIYRDVAIHNKNVIMSKPIIAPIVISPSGQADTTESKFRILYVGKLEKGKGILDLLDAVEAIHLKTYRFQLDIVGGGPLYEGIKERLKVRRLSDCINLHGYIDDVNALAHHYNSANLLVVPSIQPEGLPRVIDEGIAYAVPILASRSEALLEFATNDSSIVLFTPGCVNDLVAKLEIELANEGAGRDRRIGAGSATMRAHQNAAEQHLEVLQEICKH